MPSEVGQGRTQAAVEQAGQPPDAAMPAGPPERELVTLRLAVTGMSCAACVRRVERALGAVAGVEQVAVNLALEQAELSVRQPVAGRLPLLLDALTSGGYHGELLAAQAPPRAGPSPAADWLALAACAALTLPLLAPMLLGTLGLHGMLPPVWQLVLALPVQVGFGARFYRGAWHDLRNGSAGMDVLVMLGTSAAFLLSLVSWWQASRPGQMPALYFEAAATVITLVRLGKLLERRAKRSTGAALASLQALHPRVARRVEDGRESDCAVTALRPGDRVRVRPGEQVPVDGRIIEGASTLDLGLLTGESIPVPCRVGALVMAGGLNGDGALLLETTAVGAHTRLAQIIRLMEGAQAAKPQVQQQVDRITAAFVPAVLAVSVATGFGWWLAQGMLAPAVLNAVAVLVIACPCALGLATPTVLLVGTGLAARQGILLRDADVLEQALRIDLVAFDKTGTLTLGAPAVCAVLPTAGVTAEAVLAGAAALQAGSTHPLARAVQALAATRSLAVTPAGDLQAMPGIGVRGILDGRLLQLGQADVCRGIPVPPALAQHATEAAARGESLAWLVAGTAQPAAGQTTGQKAQVLGLLCFADAIRPESAAAVAQLKAQGLHVLMLSGDHDGAARQIGRLAGIDDVHAGLLPDQKLALIRSLQREGHHVAMVGDGINDAPALVQADLGIAMGGGADVALQAAGITLLRNDPRLVACALPLARRIHGRIRLNLLGAFCYNVIGIPLAAAGMLSPELAGLAMALSSVTVVGSALLLR